MAESLSQARQLVDPTPRNPLVAWEHAGATRVNDITVPRTSADFQRTKDKAEVTD